MELPFLILFGTFENYLKNIQTPNIDYTENIDYYHMHKVYQTVIHWLDKKDGSQKNDFKETLLKKVNFIWYQIPDGDCEAIAAFTRLNIGKIPLTDSELIKALFLNRNNLLPADKSLENKQKEIKLINGGLEIEIKPFEIVTILAEKSMS